MTTNSAQGSDEDATGNDSYSLRLRDRALNRDREGDLGKFPLFAVALSIAIAAPIMLVGLPLATFWIVQQSGCCVIASGESADNFWGSLLTGMVALFGTLITAVFVISAFRIDNNAKAEARIAAGSSVGEFLDRYRAELFQEIDRWAGQVVSKKNNAVRRMDASIADVESKKDDAVTRIDAATDAAESASNTTLANIEEARQNVVQRGEEAVETINAETSNVTNARTTAVERIEAEVAEVGRVAAEARARIEAEGPDQSTPTDSQE